MPGFCPGGALPRAGFDTFTLPFVVSIEISTGQIYGSE